MRAAILTIVGRQATAARVRTTVLILIVHRPSPFQLLIFISGRQFDLVPAARSEFPQQASPLAAAD